jgi:hypothetical protein
VSTVDEAIAFYRKNWEPDLGRSRILVADRSGASAIIGVEDGKLHVQRETICRGFGAGNAILQKTLPQQPEPTVERAFEILKQARSSGKYATKYSTVYDLAAGELYLRLTADDEEPVKLVLADELAKGRHLYSLPAIRDQLNQPLKKPSRWKELEKTVGCWFRA